MKHKVVITAYRPKVRLAIVTGATAMLALGAWGLYSYTRSTTVSDFERAQLERDQLIQERRELTGRLRTANTRIEALKDQVVYLQRAKEIDQQACAEVKASLAGLQEEVADLQEKVAFYRGIVSPDASRAGVRVYDFKVFPTASPGIFRYDLVLIQSVRHDRRIAGRVDISLKGMHAGETQVHRLSELLISGERNLLFSFKYFQEFGGEFRLPEGFRPSRAVIAVLPSGGGIPKVEDEFEWNSIQGT
jgi:hypothetical protein